MEHLWSNKKGELNTKVDTRNYKGSISGDIAEEILLNKNINYKHFEITSVSKEPNEIESTFSIIYWDF